MMVSDKIFGDFSRGPYVRVTEDPQSGVLVHWSGVSNTNLKGARIFLNAMRRALNHAAREERRLLRGKR